MVASQFFKKFIVYLDPKRGKQLMVETHAGETPRRRGSVNLSSVKVCLPLLKVLSISAGLKFVLLQ